MAQQCEETGGANSAENAPSHPVLPLAVTAKIHPGWGQCIPLLLPNVELLSPSSSAGMLRNRVESPSVTQESLFDTGLPSAHKIDTSERSSTSSTVLFGVRHC